jgi:Flp pilus assembly protein TadG
MTTFFQVPNPHRLFARFARDKGGMSVVEFGMLLPIMLSVYFGLIEVSQGIAVDRKVTLTTRTIADLSSQVQSIDNAAMTNILNATAAVVAPYDASKLKVVVSAVTIDNTGTARVAWSDTLNGTKRAVNSTVTVPTALRINNTTLIWSEVTYDYTPTVGHAITGTLVLSDQLYMRPRLSDTVTRLNS